jgi:cystinosin
MQSFLRIFSKLIGWTYFFSWSISFYPQVILNYERKTVDGLSIDFTTLNMMGHISYAIYTVNFYFNEAVRGEYRRRHEGHDNSTQLNDVAFAVHAATLATITSLQTLWYPRGVDQRLSPFNRAVVPAALLFGAITLSMVWSGSLHTIDFLYNLGIFKLYVSIAKYVPQAWINFSRQSTVGWSIGNIVLDFSGGTLSMIQLIIDASLEGDWTEVTGNPAKFGLSLLSMLFDVLFIVQHYVLYRDRKDSALENLEAQRRAEGRAAEEHERLLQD